MFNPGCMHIYKFFHQLTRKFNNFNNSNTFSINFEVTITFQSNWPTQPDSQVPVVTGYHQVTITFFFKMVPYSIAIMNEEIRKFVYDSMQERTKKRQERTFKVKFLTCNVFAFYKNLLCRACEVHVYAMM